MPARFRHAALVGKYQARGIRGVLEEIAHFLARKGLDVSLESQTALFIGMTGYGALEAHLGAVNATLDPHEQLAFVVAVTTPWTVDNGFVTPTMKVKRNRIEEVYAASYDGWVGQRRRVVWAQPS